MKPPGSVKHRNPKIANAAITKNVIMRVSLCSGFNHTHCSRLDLAAHVAYYRSLGKRPFQTSKLIRHSASISRAISFAHETLEPLPRLLKFPSFERSLRSIARQAHAAQLLFAFLALSHSWPPRESVSVPFVHRVVRGSGLGLRRQSGEPAFQFGTVHPATHPIGGASCAGSPRQHYWNARCTTRQAGHP